MPNRSTRREAPLKYKHVATLDIRRLALVWQGKEAGYYDEVKKIADDAEEDMPSFVKKLLRKAIKK